MSRLLVVVLAATIVIAAVPAASAAPWLTISAAKAVIFKSVRSYARDVTTTDGS